MRPLSSPHCHHYGAADQYDLNLRHGMISASILDKIGHAVVMQVGWKGLRLHLKGHSKLCVRPVNNNSS